MVSTRASMTTSGTRSPAHSPKVPVLLAELHPDEQIRAPNSAAREIFPSMQGTVRHCDRTRRRRRKRSTCRWTRRSLGRSCATYRSRRLAQRVKTLGPNRIYMENASPFFALNRLCRARRDGLYRTLSTLTTSIMAGRDCLPATPSDSGTHARRAHAYREL